MNPPRLETGYCARDEKKITHFDMLMIKMLLSFCAVLFGK